MDAEPRTVTDIEFRVILEKALDGDLDNPVDHAENRQEEFILEEAARNEDNAHDLAIEIIQDEGYTVEANGEDITIESESFKGYTAFRISRRGEWLLPREVTLNHKYSDAWVDASTDIFEMELLDELERIESSEPPGAAAKDAWQRSRGI